MAKESPREKKKEHSGSTQTKIKFRCGVCDVEFHNRDKIIHVKDRLNFLVHRRCFVSWCSKHANGRAVIGQPFSLAKFIKKLNKLLKGTI